MNIIATKTYNDINSFLASPEAKAHGVVHDLGAYTSITQQAEYIEGSCLTKSGGKIVDGITISDDDSYNDLEALQSFLTFLDESSATFTVATLLILRQGKVPRFIILSQ